MLDIKPWTPITEICNSLGPRHTQRKNPAGSHNSLVGLSFTTSFVLMQGGSLGHNSLGD